MQHLGDAPGEALELGGKLFNLERARPEYIFLFFAVLAGLTLLVMVTPFAGGNERMNYQRAVLIADGHVQIAPAAMPGGIQQMLELTDKLLPEGTEAPYRFTPEQGAQLRSIRLERERPAIVPPNAIAVLHPIAYLPQVPVMAAGMRLDLSPLTLFWLGRVAGLAVGVVLTFWAIRIAPRNRYLLAAVALMPQMLFSRTTLDADQLTNGVAFLFLSLLMRELVEEGPMRARRLVALAATAFVFAQAKSAYLLLPLLALAIPAERFASRRHRVFAMALIMLPGLIGSVAWMLTLRNGYFAHAAYQTWSGVVVPDRQVQAVLSSPLGYVEVLLRTVFTTAFIPKAIFDFLGAFGPPVSVPLWFDLAIINLFVALLVAEPQIAGGPLDRLPVRLAAGGLSLVSVVIILTLLYVQWTRVGAPLIDGFNGRYLYPLAPLAVLMVRGKGEPLFRFSAAHWLCVAGVLSLGATLWVTAQTY
ncbi:DUF2142 domain-containing protein [Sphingomonas sp. BN140010]|uniref:DUF2142 domain-containing protein n=1 Tax=Sphingomonas arvum TaxID=2992113 RepID=A0ABT3JI70_9SPHN|nr:DUF2142 domain-containing protein [Sphingomonas sp. BN140010]MCW3798782.1 DUF2142 domain-containing protein [Sphingomonas sp. BN140010]